MVSAFRVRYCRIQVTQMNDMNTTPAGWMAEMERLAHQWAIQSYYKGLGRECDIDGARAKFLAHARHPTEGAAPASDARAAGAPQVIAIGHVAPPGFGPMTDMLRAPSAPKAAPIEADLPVQWEGADGTAHEISLDYAAHIAKWMFDTYGDVPQVDAAIAAAPEAMQGQAVADAPMQGLSDYLRGQASLLDLTAFGTGSALREWAAEVDTARAQAAEQVAAPAAIGVPAPLERWGFKHEGAQSWVDRMEDGYWTPWHLADEALRAAAPLPQGDGALTVIAAAEGLLGWCVKNVQQWHFPEWDRLDKAIAAMRSSSASEGGNQHGDV